MTALSPATYPRRAFRSNRGSAFTLVELLVSMAVLTLLIVLVAQLTTGATSTTTSSTKRMDDEGQARLVLDRLSLDFSKMVKRSDVDYGFSKTAGNDALSFYAETSGYPPAGAPSGTTYRTLSVVGYRIDTTGATPYTLDRGAKALAWGEMTFTPLVSGNQTQSLVPANSLPVIANADYEVLADQVFRLEFTYLLKATSTLAATPPAKISDVAAVVVGVAVLDSRSRGILSAGQLAGLSAKFPDAVDGQDIASLWSPIASNTGNLGVPPAVASVVRVYQRYFYLSQGL